MKYFKEPAQHIGWLFVLATVAGVLSVVVMSSTFGAEDLLSAVQDNQGSLLLGNMLIFVMLTAMVGTAVLLHPVLRKHDEKLALGYVLARGFEVVILSVGMVAALLLVPLSWEFAAASSADMASTQVLAKSLKAASDWSGYVGAQMVFSLSALVLNWAFYRNGLIPRWLSLWGLIGVPLMFVSGLLVMFESLNSDASTLNLLVVPLAVQEMAMAVWLIVKGFSDITEHEPKLKASKHLATAH
ncbi:MAG: DUF4386 domain-containing protein [Acidimicrobiales bacterium]|nr:DUF4386 domain-containing protein [Acidimicrobiales bacterium]